MPHRPYEIFREIDSETRWVKKQLSGIRRTGTDRTTRLRRLADRRTHALVQLSQHYLPDLTQSSMESAWREVREEVRDLLLQKQDHRRTLLGQLADLENQRQTLESERESAKESLHRERVILSCKEGNFRKLLREDAEIVRANQEIMAIDEEIECCLVVLERTERDARQKLPAYERCQLFNYLREQNYGTAAYQGRGLTRRWDRWVAKLIDYKTTKAGFDFLTETPVQLQELINKKQLRYRELLEVLEAARKRAAQQHGIPTQQTKWANASKRLGELDDAIEQLRWKETALKDQIYHVDNINGEFYEQSLKIYQQFLSDLDPEILKVYAACTDSPVDDEICARMRHLQKQIAQEQDDDKERELKIEKLQQYQSGLTELRDRLREYLRATPADVEFHDDLHFAALLQRLRLHQQTPGEIWRAIRQAVLLPPSTDAWIHESSDRGEPIEINPARAAFLAASETSDSTDSIQRLDREGVIVTRSHQDPVVGPADSFVVAAICRSEQEATDVCSALSSHGVDSFTVDPTVDVTMHLDETRVSQGESPDAVLVMVKTESAAKARQLLHRRQSLGEASWSCSHCAPSVALDQMPAGKTDAGQLSSAQVPMGYGVCYRCGNRRRFHSNDRTVSQNSSQNSRRSGGSDLA